MEIVVEGSLQVRDLEKEGCRGDLEEVSMVVLGTLIRKEAAVKPITAP